MTRCDPRDRYQTVDEVLTDIPKLPKLSTVSTRLSDDREVPSNLVSTSNFLSLPSVTALFILASGLLATGTYLFGSDRQPIPQSNILTKTMLSSPAIAFLDGKASYDRLSFYLKEKNWQAADHETYLLLLKSAGSQSYNDGTFYSDEFSRITCADLVLIDQLWTQATNGKQGLTAQRKIYEDSARDIRKTYENIGWISPSGEQAIDTAYNRSTLRWEYIESRQPNFKSPPIGHLPFLLRDPFSKTLERTVPLYRCSS